MDLNSTFPATVSNSTTTTCIIVEQLFSTSVENLIITLYVLITACGLAGNGIVIYAFVTKRVKCTPFMALLLNLSISDLLMALTIYPYIFMDMKKMEHISQTWANLLCAIGIGLAPFWACMCVNAFTMMAISFIRYMSFLPPGSNTTRRITWRNTSIAISIIWVLAFLIMLPNYFSYTLDKPTGICYRTWPKNFNGTLYSVLTTAMLVVCPITILAGNFCITVRRMRTKSEASASNFIRRERKRVTTLLLALIAAYFICWTPGFIYMVLSRLDPIVPIFPPGVHGEYSRMRVIRINMMVAVCNTVCDPVLYAFTWKSFRQGFLLPARASTSHESNNATLPKLSFAGLKQRFTMIRRPRLYTL